MSWQLLIALSVFLFSLNGLFHRVLMKDIKSNAFAQTIVFYGLGAIFSFIIALYRGGFHYQIEFTQTPYFILLAIFATAAPVVVFKAAKTVEASESSILLSSQRLWIVFGAFIFLNESFSLKKIVGTIIILFGITFAQWKKQKFVLNQGAIYIFMAALFYAIADIIAFNILRSFDAASFNVYLCIIPVITLLLIKPDTIKKLNFYFKPKYALNIMAVSLNDTVASLLSFFAYQIGRNASQISPIMATQTILTVILAIIFLKERSFILNKIIGAIIVVAGVVLVI